MVQGPRTWQETAAARLQAAGVPSPVADAAALLGAGTGLDRTALLLRGDTPLDPPTLGRLEHLLERRLAREPLHHLLSEVDHSGLEWGGVRLRCDRRALIPRPETEWLLHLALHDPALNGPASNDSALNDPARRERVVDIGTGSGALALAWRAARPWAEVTAVDLSADALALARENAALNGLDVTWVQGDLLAPLAGGPPFDLILSNPPYLPDGDRGTLDPEVEDHDPPLALYGGPDGLELARRLAAQAAPLLAPGGVMWLELDGRNAGTFAAELEQQGWRAAVHPDLTGRQRFVRAERRRGRGRE